MSKEDVMVSVGIDLDSLKKSLASAQSAMAQAFGASGKSAGAFGVTINNLLPGTFDTARLAGNFAAQAARQGVSTEQAIAARLAKHPAHRFGRPDELGNTCAYVCSVHAGYINGQNILLDGGSFPGVF